MRLNHPHELNRKCEDGLCWGGRTDCAGCHQIDPELGGPTQRIEVGVEPIAFRPETELAIVPLAPDDMAALASVGPGE